MSDFSARLALPFLMPQQAQKHVTVNEALLRLDAYVGASALSATRLDQPAAPQPGESHILPPGRTGAAWSTFPVGTLVSFQDGIWHDLAAPAGLRVWITDAAQAVMFDGAVWRAASSTAEANRLINPAFRIQQRKFGAVADDVYAIDRWYVLTESGAVTAAPLSTVNASPQGLRLTQSHAAPQRFGLAQIVENSSGVGLEAKLIAMTARLRCSANTAIRYAILEWTGNADAVISDAVANWSNTGFSPGQFFKATSMGVCGTRAQSLPANLWTALETLRATPSAAMQNLIVFLWTDTPVAQGTTLDFAEAQLEPGAFCSAFTTRPDGAERALCQRYFEPLAGIGGAPGVSPFAQRVSTNIIDCFQTFAVTKRAVPVLASSAPAFVSSNPATQNQMGFYDNVAANYVSTTGAVSLSLSGESPQASLVRLISSTAFSTPGGNMGNLYLGAGALVGFDAEL